MRVPAPHLDIAHRARPPRSIDAFRACRSGGRWRSRHLDAVDARPRLSVREARGGGDRVRRRDERREGASVRHARRFARAQGIHGRDAGVRGEAALRDERDALIREHRHRHRGGAVGPEAVEPMRARRTGASRSPASSSRSTTPLRRSCRCRPRPSTLRIEPPGIITPSCEVEAHTCSP